MQRVSGWAEQGGHSVVVGGLTSTAPFQESYPLATVTVYLTGTLTLATLFSDNSSTPLANPFTADTNGFWFFYAANGRYDVNFSGSGISAPFTIGDILLADPTGGAGAVTSWTGAQGSTRQNAVVALVGDYTARYITNLGYSASADYIFTAQTPGGSLSIGSNTITLTPVPLGVNGADVGHYLYISGGTGGAEAVLITGGTATSGSSSGTVIVTCANNHSGAWTIQSATSGVQEAVSILPSTGGKVYVNPGTVTLNASVSFGGKTNVVIEVASGVTLAGSGGLPASLVNNQTWFIEPNFVGSVVMRRPNITSYNWIVYKPDGGILDTTGTTSMGLKEGWDYAWNHGYPFIVWGGGITNFTTGVPSLATYSNISLSAPLSIITGDNNYAALYNVNLNNFGTGFDITQDMVTFDSMDLSTIDFMDSQMLYAGSGSCFRFNPQHNNGEGFAGITQSTVRLGHIVIVDGINSGVVDDTRAIGVRISMPALGLGLPAGNGLCRNMRELGVSEINGGLIGWQIDIPGAGNTFDGNNVDLGQTHGQGSESVKIGTGSTALIGSNVYKGVLAPANTGIALRTWGGVDPNTSAQWQGDKFDISIEAGSVGIQFEASAANNLVLIASISAGTALVNNATAQTNLIVGTRILEDGGISVSASPFVYQNHDCMPEMVTWTGGGGVTLVESSADGATYHSISVATTGNATIKQGQYLRVTYTGAAPQMRVIW